jgi:hypothetical protein
MSASLASDTQPVRLGDFARAGRLLKPLGSVFFPAMGGEQADSFAP